MGLNKSNVNKDTSYRIFEILDENGRVCSHCNIYKPWFSFGEKKKDVTGKKDLCSICYRFKNNKKEKSKYKTRKQKLKATIPIEYRSRDIRSKLMSRAKEDEKHLVPSKEDIKEWLLSQYPFKCYYSGEYIDIFDCQVDHKIPVYRGGSNAVENIVLSTERMNGAKGDMTDEEFIGLLDFVSSWEDKGKGLIARLRRGFIINN